MAPRDLRDCDCHDCAGSVLRFLEWLHRRRGPWLTAFLLCALAAVLIASWLYLG